jgi:NAD(P)-dependent dehydrogenase (short-subunit alcohol dehydrogenase family)
MNVQLKKVAEQVIVLTGASSGIGLATARMAARHGARLVLAARNEDALRQLVGEIEQGGGQAVHVVADVGKEEDVRAITRTAVERFGGFDTWVNDAGGSLYGRLLDTPTADFRRLFDTNFWGVVYGALEAARHLGGRGGRYGGAIINLGSEVSDRSLPLQGMYASSKHAVKGFTDALRMELEEAGAPVSVTLVKPTAIDTPFPEHAQNYLDQEPALPPPLYAPEVVAEAILHCAETPERDVFVGGPAKAHSLMGVVAPRLTDWLMELFYFGKQKSGRAPNRADDALYAPTTGLRERGQSPGRVRESSLYTRAALHPVLTGALVLGAGLAVAALIGAAASDGRRG